MENFSLADSMWPDNQRSQPLPSGRFCWKKGKVREREGRKREREGEREEKREEGGGAGGEGVGGEERGKEWKRMNKKEPSAPWVAHLGTKGQALF